MKNKQKLQESAWHTKDSSDVLSEFETNDKQGLSGDESRKRREKYGPNKIRSGEKKPWYVILLHQFTDPLIYILLIAAVVSLFIQEITDASVIMAVVILNGAIGFIQETRARKAIRSLAEMSAPKARVLRDGQKQEINSEEIVPGDIIVLASGGSVPSDCRLLEARDLAADESALTGESEPVNKQTEAVDDEKAVPGDQFCMVFAGTHITSGRGKGIAVRTGEVSELGRIAEKTSEMEDVETPIQQKMAWLGKAIGVAVFVLSLVVVGMGLLMGWELREIIRTAVALAVGTVPEALPIVLTVTLAVGVQRMAKRNAIIRQLPAVETLGSTTVIGSDKTGTLTENQMTVKAIWAGGNRYDIIGTGYNADGEIKSAQEDQKETDQAVKKVLLAGLLASETENMPDEDGGGGGDPTEMAMLASALKGGYEIKDTRKEYSQQDIIPFESEQKFMATLNNTPDGPAVFLKGAPEAVLDRCSRQLTSDGGEEDLDTDKAREMAEKLADEGFRVIGLAVGSSDQESFDGNDPGEDLIFAGFQGLEDPVRPEAVEAVKAAHESGIRVLMLTGDHVRTARAIGQRLGLEGEEAEAQEGRNLEDLSDDDLGKVVRDVNVYARVSPDHKLKLVETLKRQGHIVAVTGDGVNDAPALQAAHLGVAMGKAGTDVAREASDMVLADDNFSSITNAVREGRVVFANIRKVTYFLLSTGVGLVITILSALFGPWPLPYVAAQVLWINLVTKGLQDVSLAFEPGEPGLLRESPRSPKEGVINKPVLMRMVGFGIYMAIGTLAVFWWIVQQDVSLEMSRSVAMTQMVMFQFFHVFNCRSMHRSLFQINLLGNPYLLGSMGLALLAHLGILHVSWLQSIFRTEPLSSEIWMIIVAVSATIIVVSEIDKIFIRWSRNKAAKERRREQQRADNKE